MKTYPAAWNSERAAYFAGLLCAELILTSKMGTAEVEELTRRNTHRMDGQTHIRFHALISQIEPRIDAKQWDAIVNVCRRIFK